MDISRAGLAAKALCDWLLTEGRTLSGGGRLAEALAGRLADAGVPVWRLTLHMPQLNPQIRSIIYRWTSDGGPVEDLLFNRRRPSLRDYNNSPIGLQHRTMTPVRRRLAGPEAELDFALLEELAAHGGTEYLLLPMPLGSGLPASISVTTRDPGGFADGHAHLLEAILPALGAVVEIHIQRAVTVGLLGAYVGPDSAERILAGEITLGSSRSIRAVIFFCDLRGFTGLSESLGREPLLGLLNDYFGVMAGAVKRAGGEVLKFVGDGMMAIFRVGDGEPVDEACAAAIIAAFEAVQDLAGVNDRRKARGEAEIRAGIALHLGTVLYGNIGAEDRLDFTVVGPAVNLAARIEALTAVLDRPILASEAFAAASPVRLLPLGRHRLKGIEAPQTVYAPARTQREAAERPGAAAADA
jgi:adenylate cyclase